MHVPGVKQEQPDRRPGMTGPLVATTVIRDRDNTRVAKVNNEDPRKTIQILNSLIRKTDGRLYVDVMVRDAGNNRVCNVNGKEGREVIRILNSLIKKTRDQTSQEEMVIVESTEDYEGDIVTT
jgi:hypothetical protein